MKISDLTPKQLRWYKALWNETGGAISPAAAAKLYPEDNAEAQAQVVSQDIEPEEQPKEVVEEQPEEVIEEVVEEKVEEEL